jgi:hypothetical protein
LQRCIEFTFEGFARLAFVRDRERIYAAIKPLGWTLYGFDGCPTQAGFTCFEGEPFRSREIRVEPPLFAIIERMHRAEAASKGGA